jgi:iron complex transport system substrate-binding protein
MPGIKPGMTWCLFAALLWLTSPPVSAATLPRVASTTVCADQYLLALAAPEQIVALSGYARDPALSYDASRAKSFAQTRGTAEELIALKPDLVLGEGYGLRATEALLAREGIHLVMLPAPESFDGVAQALRDIGNAIGRREAGAEAAADLARRKEALAEAAPARRVSALYLLPSGSTAGRQTFIDDVLTVAGVANYAAAHGLNGWGRASLETMAADPPGLLVLGFFDRRVRSATAGFAANPVFLRTLARTPRLEVPNALWICAGPMLIGASEYIADHMRDGSRAIASKSAP